jgi:two-component system, NarL family, nitrate/nitrite response regulator NarL
MPDLRNLVPDVSLPFTEMSAQIPNKQINGADVVEGNAEQKGRLTEREQQVAALVCIGLSNKIVARKLKVSEGTVKLHLHRVFQKLGVQRRAELAFTLSLEVGR